MAYNQVVYGKRVLINLQGDTVASNTLLPDITAHDKTGAKVSGTLFKSFPKEVSVPKIGSSVSGTIKHNNIVKFNGKTLIDISSDTVTSDTLLYGCVAHRKDGTMMNGNFLKDYPAAVSFEDDLKDSSGNSIFDSTGKEAIDTTVNYKKTSTSTSSYTYTR